MPRAIRGPAKSPGKSVTAQVLRLLVQPTSEAVLVRRLAPFWFGADLDPARHALRVRAALIRLSTQRLIVRTRDGWLARSAFQ